MTKMHDMEKIFVESIKVAVHAARPHTGRPTWQFAQAAQEYCIVCATSIAGTRQLQPVTCTGTCPCLICAPSHQPAQAPV